MKRKHEIINGCPISCWQDNDCFDKYTVVYLDEVFKHPAHHYIDYVMYVGMSENPFHPQGFCQHGEMPINAVQYKGRGGCFQKRIKFADLPSDCQKAVLNDISLDYKQVAEK
jgi:hypothetical protein